MPDEFVPLLITEKAAARLIGLSDSTLIAARFRGAPLLPFVRVGQRSIRYRLSDVHEFVDRGVDPVPAHTGAPNRNATPNPRKAIERDSHVAKGDVTR